MYSSNHQLRPLKEQDQPLEAKFAQEQVEELELVVELEQVQVQVLLLLLLEEDLEEVQYPSH